MNSSAHQVRVAVEASPARVEESERMERIEVVPDRKACREDVKTD